MILTKEIVLFIASGWFSKFYSILGVLVPNMRIQPSQSNFPFRGMVDFIFYMWTCPRRALPISEMRL